MLLAILAAGVLVRLLLRMVSTESNMDPDAAHFLNIARAFDHGQGFVNPAAWPAWMQPARLPMPETFKEPGYPWLIAQLGVCFKTGQWISIVAGALLPLVTFLLARRRALDSRVALLAAALVAFSPLAMLQSVRVMVDVLFALVVTAMFWLASRDLAAEGDRPLWRDLLAGALFGAAFLLRAQTLMLLIPFVWLLGEARKPAPALARIGLALVVAAAVASPFWLRNLRLFHTPLYSNVVAYGLWPYVDHLAFSHGLDHPPAVLPFVLSHVPQVIEHMVVSVMRFTLSALPEEIIGHAFWMLPLAVGIALALGALRTWAFALLYLAITFVFVMAVHWDARYFTSSVPLYCLLTASGAIALWERVASLTLVGPFKASAVVLGATALVFLLQFASARRTQATFHPPELDAARREAAFLRARLKPDEAVLAVTTSYWSWFADRPSVHMILSDTPRFDAAMTRLKVRWAALPTSRLAEFAARSPGGQLPPALVFDHADTTVDISIFEVHPEGKP
jgi:4-amino-4-deoxy-L-arabinose transferase-like glycosyltransferase